MKKIFLFCAFVFAIAGATYAQAPATQKTENPPRFEFREEVHDFGTVDEGPNLVWKFHFKNVGGSPLIIEQASTGDGGSCVSNYTKKPVLPGKEGFVEIMQSTYRRNMFQHVVYIRSNAFLDAKTSFNGKARILTFKGQITPKTEVSK